MSHFPTPVDARNPLFRCSRRCLHSPNLCSLRHISAREILPLRRDRIFTRTENTARPNIGDERTSSPIQTSTASSHDPSSTVESLRVSCRASCTCNRRGHFDGSDQVSSPGADWAKIGKNTRNSSATDDRRCRYPEDRARSRVGDKSLTRYCMMMTTMTTTTTTIVGGSVRQSI